MTGIWRSAPVILALALGLQSLPASAQILSPGDQEQARIRAEREAAERQARENAPVASVDQAAAAVLGPFPTEAKCFPTARIEVTGIDRPALRWVPAFVDQFRDRCIGVRGLDYILRSLSAGFLDRGLVTTRAGLPEQDLASGTLRIIVVPGVIEGVRVNRTDRSRAWNRASPVDRGDLVNLRGVEQALEQLRSVPGRDVRVDLSPGSSPGGSIIDVTLRQPRPVAGSISVNNFAGERVGRWQGAAQIAELGQLGFNEVISLYYNQRVDAPGLPANSRGAGGTIAVPLGWWTFGVAASANRYSQTVSGNVATFGTRGKLDRVSAFAERVIFRDQTTKTSLSVGLSRRWGRNFIDDIEIGLQRQDLTDLEVRLIDRRTFGRIRLDTAAGVRFGVGLFGAQAQPADRPTELPSARYRIFNADIGIVIPLGNGFLESYRGEFRGQVSTKNLFGSDLIQVGGPYTVRGLDSDTADLGRSGFFARQEIGARITDDFRPYALFDFGQIEDGLGIRGGAGGGLRARRGPLSLDAFAALPVFGKFIVDRRRVRFGLSASLGF